MHACPSAVTSVRSCPWPTWCASPRLAIPRSLAHFNMAAMRLALTSDRRSLHHPLLSLYTEDVRERVQCLTGKLATRCQAAIPPEAARHGDMQAGAHLRQGAHACSARGRPHTGGARRSGASAAAFSGAARRVAALTLACRPHPASPCRRTTNLALSTSPIVCRHANACSDARACSSALACCTCSLLASLACPDAVRPLAR